MKKLLFIFVLLIVGYKFFFSQQEVPLYAAQQSIETVGSETSTDTIIANAYSNHTSNIQVSGNGTVIKTLPDDNHGSRHQKFIIKLDSGQTLLVAHNIDLAPKISSIQRGDRIEFYGEYEWNSKGGVIHWTHQDPNGSHVAGWLKHNGRTYQ